ncbi:MAG: hypothetical protein Q8N77_00230, partial [Nanoarchaeota archaeon]|nr:hypothetical protein [Nanoarchaeota archaeon]
MKTIILIHPPFCTPVSPSYSISHIYAALKNSCKSEYKIKALDLNVELNSRSHPEFSEYSKRFLDRYEPKEYEPKAKSFIEKTKQDLAESNRSVIKGAKPLLFDEMLETVRKHKPD